MVEQNPRDHIQGWKFNNVNGTERSREVERDRDGMAGGVVGNEENGAKIRMAVFEESMRTTVERHVTDETQSVPAGDGKFARRGVAIMENDLAGEVEFRRAASVRYDKKDRSQDLRVGLGRRPRNPLRSRKRRIGKVGRLKGSWPSRPGGHVRVGVCRKG